MTAILFVILGAAIAYFLMTSKSQSKEAMQAAPVGDNISQLVHYKRRIFQTSAYEEESTYQAIYCRIAQLTEDQISKHNNKLISAEAEREIRENFEKYFEVEAGCWRVKRTLQLEDVPAGVLLGIAIQSLWGNKKYTAMKIEQNRFFANRAIEFLVVVKKYEPAILAKGLVLLYGFQEYLPTSRAGQGSARSPSPGRTANGSLGKFSMLRSFTAINLSSLPNHIRKR